MAWKAECLVEDSARRWWCEELASRIIFEGRETEETCVGREYRVVPSVVVAIIPSLLFARKVGEQGHVRSEGKEKVLVVLNDDRRGRTKAYKTQSSGYTSVKWYCRTLILGMIAAWRKRFRYSSLCLVLVNGERQ